MEDQYLNLLVSVFPMAKLIVVPQIHLVQHQALTMKLIQSFIHLRSFEDKPKFCVAYGIKATQQVLS